VCACARSGEFLRMSPILTTFLCCAGNLLCSLAFHVQTEKLFALLDAHRNVVITDAFTDAQGQSPLHFGE
jgi:hypothetical protein